MDSIADQSTDYKVQVIVINDGSTDSTEAILEKYRCFSDWIIINQENRGFSGARNVGLDLAEGKYIMFVIKRVDNATKDYINRIVEI